MRSPLPPGSASFPLIGDTLSFLKDSFGLIDRAIAEHGSIFRLNVFGHDTAVISGPAAADLFIREDLILRSGATPKHVQELLGGRSLGVIDGPEHRTRKKQVLAGFGREALTSYVPAMQRIVERAFARWQQAGEVRAVEEYKRLSLEAIAKNVLDLDAGPRLDEMLSCFVRVTAGVTSIPVALPGTKYKDALAARDRILEMMKEDTVAHRKTKIDDGLTRILAAKADDGSTITDDEAAMELHHINIAGYVIFGELSRMTIELAKNKALHAELKAEVESVAAGGALSIEQLMAMRAVGRFVQEVKRVVPIVPALFARAEQDIEFQGYRIPKGWHVWWAVRASQHEPSIFAEPARFDPSRFSDARAEDKKHVNGFTPHGPGPATGHKCPGTDYATVFMTLFAALLVRDWKIDLPAQELELDWSKIPPEPKDGLKLRVERTAPKPKSKMSRDVFVALAAIAWADGEVSEAEATALIGAAEASGLRGAELDAVRSALSSRTELDRLSQLSLAAEEREFVYAIASWLVRVDGVIEPAETAALARLAGILSLGEVERDRVDLAVSALELYSEAGAARDFSLLAKMMQGGAS